MGAFPRVEGSNLEGESMQSILILLLVTLLFLATAAWRLAMPATPPAREGTVLAVASEPPRPRRIDRIFEYEPPSASPRPGASARLIAPTSEPSQTPGGPRSASAPEPPERARSLRRLLSLYERIGPGD